MAESSSAAAPQRRRRAPRENKGEGASAASDAAPATTATTAAAATQPNGEGAAPSARGGRGRGRGRGGRGRGRGRAPRGEAGAPAAGGKPNAIVGEVQPDEVFVRNLPRQFGKDEVLALLTPFGEVKRVRLLRNFGRLSAHVRYGTAEFATAAIAGLENKDSEGRTLHASSFVKVPRRPRAENAAEPAAGAAPAPANKGGAKAEGKTEGKPEGSKRPRRQKKPAAEADGAAAAAPAAAAAGEAKGARRAPRPVDSKVIWIGNLPENFPEDELKSKIADKNAKLIMRRNYAKAIFETEDIAAEVIKALNGLKINENEIKAEVARPTRSPQRRQRKVAPSNSNPLKVWIGKLPEGYSDTAISGLFVGVTQLETHDRFAYLTFDTEANANAAVQKNNQPLLGGDPIPVAIARN